MSIGVGNVDTNENNPNVPLGRNPSAPSSLNGLKGNIPTLGKPDVAPLSKAAAKKKVAPLRSRSNGVNAASVANNHLLMDPAASKKKKGPPVALKPPNAAAAAAAAAAFYAPPPYMAYGPPPMGMPPPPPGKAGQYAPPPHPAYGYPHPAAYPMHHHHPHHPVYAFPPPPYPMPTARPTKAVTKKPKKSKAAASKAAKQAQQSKKVAAAPVAPPPPVPSSSNEALKHRMASRPLPITSAQQPPSAPLGVPGAIPGDAKQGGGHPLTDMDRRDTKPQVMAPSVESAETSWTKDDDEKLKTLVEEHGSKNWDIIAKKMPGRSEQSCVSRWQKVLKPQLVKGPWTEEEDKKLMELVKEVGAKRWTHIAGELPGRNGKQCRERWHNHLNPSITKRAWNVEEDRTILECHMSMGNKWAGIAKYLPGR